MQTLTNYAIAALLVIGSLGPLAMQAQDTNACSPKQAEKWFAKKEYLNGLSLKPHSSITKKEFCRQYHTNQAYWDKAFAWLKTQDLNSLPKGRIDIDGPNGENVYAIVQLDSTKDFANTRWECHRKYIDVQCVITGEEKMGKTPLAQTTVVVPYDESKDIGFYTAEGKFYTIPAGTFIIFFPGEAHRPNIAPGNRAVDRKIVVKVRAAE